MTVLKNLRGRVAYIFSERNFDIDQIVGIRNYKVQDIAELAKLSMAEYDPDFRTVVQTGDLLVGAANFGYGHPHYQAMQVMRHLGITGVIAESFGLIYSQIEICAGFPQISCPGILAAVARWDDIEVDWSSHSVVNHTQEKRVEFEPLSKTDQAILAAGGIVPYLKQETAA